MTLTGNPLYDLSAGLLDWYRAALGNAGLLFETVYVADGRVAWPNSIDVGALVVQHTQTLPLNETGGPSAATVLRPNTASLDYFSVFILRAVPTMGENDSEAPSADEMNESAALILADRWQARQATWALTTDSLSPVDACQSVQLLGIRAVGADGGIGGTQIDFAIGI